MYCAKKTNMEKAGDVIKTDQKSNRAVCGVEPVLNPCHSALRTAALATRPTGLFEKGHELTSYKV